MASKENVQEWMQVIVDRIDEHGPDVVADWGGALQIVIPDLHTGWLVKLAMDGTVESCEEVIDEAAANCVLEMPSDIFVGVYSKAISTDAARGSGKLRVRKDQIALIRIMPITMRPTAIQ